MKFSMLFASIFAQAVLHKEFVGAKSDKLLGALNRGFTPPQFFYGPITIERWTPRREWH